MDISDRKVFSKISHKILKLAHVTFTAKTGRTFYHGQQNWYSQGQYVQNPNYQADESYFGQLIDDAIAQHGAGPHDAKGIEMKVGDNIAAAVTYGRTASLELDTITEIKMKGQCVSVIKGNSRTYRNPHNIIVLK